MCQRLSRQQFGSCDSGGFRSPGPSEEEIDAADEDYEPDFEGIMEARAERRRPEGDTW